MKKILRFLRGFLPLKLMIRIEYFIKCRRILHLKNPKRYSEKIQWYKLYYKNPLMVICSDKEAVTKYVESKGLTHIINERYATFSDYKEINFDKLPNSFIIKLNTGSNKYLIVQDKAKINKNKTMRQMKRWLKINKRDMGSETIYKQHTPKIIVEKLLSRDENNDIPDYKFFCFDGRVEFLYTMIDYVDNHKKGKLGFFDREFKQMPVKRKDFKVINRTIKKPENYEKMIEYAEILSKDFPHVRVDFYEVEGKIIFGELTFYNASGFVMFDPDKYDYIFGELFKLPGKALK